MGTKEEDINKVHAEHRKRLQQQTFSSSADSMSEIQLVEYLLTLAIPRIDTNPIAHKLLNEFGSLHAILDADYSDLIKVKGIGPKSAMCLKSLCSIFYYYRESKRKNNKQILGTPNQIIDFFKDYLESKPNEEIYIACLNAKNEVLKVEKIASGDTASLTVSQRQISEVALKINATTVAIGHNHPQGEPFPSLQDIEATKKIIEALNVFNISVSDHVIIGKNENFSFLISGILSEIKSSLIKPELMNISNRIYGLIKK